MWQEKVDAVIFRSKCNTAVAYECNSKYFFALEKHNYNKKVMNKIYKDNGELTVCPVQILEEQKKFYSKLYTANEEVKFRLENESTVRVTEEENEILGNKLTLEELTNAVKELSAEKTPGNNGLNTLFYQFFWLHIKQLYFEMILYSMQEHKLSLSAHRGVITLIPKKKDPMWLKNWRPLTMLNTDYKILAKALANRLKIVLPRIISHDQTGFMKGRQITSTIRKTIEIIDYTRKHQVVGYLLNMDFETCFDKIEYGTIRGALRYFDIDDTYIEMVNLLLNDFESCTTNSGNFYEYFAVSRSCHQGCPLALLLFNVCGECLAHQIKQNSNIEGITVYNLKQIISQFADDTQLFIKNTIQELNAMIDTLSQLETNIRLTINYSKSCIYLLGNSKPIEWDKPWVWDPGGFTLLGVEVGTDYNYANQLGKAKNVVKLWCNRNLTLMGK